MIYIKDGVELEENIPPDIPELSGIDISMRVYVDSDHAGDTTTQRSRTEFVIFLNSAPIYWSTKKQGLCEKRSFGSQFCAMKQATEYVRGLCYKLRIMCIPVNEPSFVFGNN